MEYVAFEPQAERRKPGVSHCTRLAGVLTGVLAGVLGLVATVWSEAALSQDSVFLPKIEVIAPSPLSGSTARSRAPSTAVRTAPAQTPVTSTNEAPGIDRDKIAASTQTLSAEDFSRSYSPSITETLMQRVPGVSTSNIQGNEFTQDLRYRGFAASPLQGTPQGLAVYMNGIRVNEAFGDTVNWDLIPTNAINRADIWTNNPTFGLNALGGAVNIQMKNGFSYSGTEIEAQGGSFGRVGGGAQFGREKDGVGLYLAAQGVKDDGWRYQSPAEVRRFYGDLGWKGDRAEVHLIGSVGKNNFGVVGPTPIQLLNQDPKAIYTWPQTTQNQVQLVALNGKVNVSDHWTLQSNLYIRNFQQRHVDGNAADIERCSGNGADPLFNLLCLNDDAAPGASAASRQILTSSNAGIPCPPLGGANPCSTVPYGTIDRTSTDATTIGASAEASSNAKLFGHGNSFSFGGSVDHSRVGFGANSELGFIFPDLSVGPNSAIPGTGSIIHTAGNIGYSPVSLNARSSYYGLYTMDVFDITSTLSLNAGARLNVAKIGTADLLGTSPDLNGEHTFTKLNPMVGLAYKISDKATVYGGYSEANRAPTPLELGCSNPSKPCLLEGFLVSDPPLQQVTARTYEAGLRGKSPLRDGLFEWKVGLFRTDLRNDIINVASAIQGRGVFQNVSATRRQGLEASAEYRSKKWFVYANYSFIDATYQFSGDIPSPNNPSADANGNVSVTPGKKIPGIPQHQFKAGAEYLVNPAWKIGADVIVVGSQYFVGDDANQNDKLSSYWVANLHTSYDLSNNVRLFGLVNNLFNKTYHPYGTYFDPQSVTNAIATVLTDQRTLTPGQPLSVYVGMKVRL
jgi:iron complex outermembrane receptor protein